MSRWPFGAVAPTAARMGRIPFKFFDFERFTINISEQAAGAFAVEAGGRNDGVLAFLTIGPGLGVQLAPVMPLVVRRVAL